MPFEAAYSAEAAASAAKAGLAKKGRPMQYVYLLESNSEPARRYVGLSSALKRRLEEHNAGKSIHTARFRPWRLDLRRVFEPSQGRRFRAVPQIRFRPCLRKQTALVMWLHHLGAPLRPPRINSQAKVLFWPPIWRSELAAVPTDAAVDFLRKASRSSREGENSNQILSQVVYLRVI